jgi:uncharacterized protein (TIGR00251 family)
VSAPRLQQSGDDVLLWIKAVPGASRDQVAGVLGERLKVRISAPPEAGKANDAIRTLLAKTLGLRASSISIEAGHSSVEKTVRLAGATVDAVRAALEAAM